MSKQITNIPARPNQDEKRLKVATYCRVSTEHEEQRESIKSQVAYYTQKICDNPDWDFAGIYAEQESGTRVDNREEIQRLMNNCRNGKVDLILMKSLSRFGRNTLDVLLMLDELSKLNVVAYFETENIWSNDPRVKKYITMVAAAYQEESRQKSEAIILLPKLIRLIFLQVNKKKTKDKYIRLLLRMLTKRLLAKKCLKLYRI